MAGGKTKEETECIHLEVFSLDDSMIHANHLCINGNSVFSGTLREAKKCKAIWSE